MQKDFDKWNSLKRHLEIAGWSSQPFHERDVWWCSLGVNLGDEEDGKNNLFERPVLVLKKFNNRLAWVIPMTSKHKISPYYFLMENPTRTDSAILSAIT